MKTFVHRALSWLTLWRVAVRAVVRLLSELLSEGFCESGCCQSGCCQSGCCQSGCCQSRSQASRQSKSATNLLHPSIIDIYTARTLPKRHPWDNPKATQNAVEWMRKPKQRTKMWTPTQDPKPQMQARRKECANPIVQSTERSQIV